MQHAVKLFGAFLISACVYAQQISIPIVGTMNLSSDMYPLPSQSGKATAILTTNGTTARWSWTEAISATGPQPILPGTTIIADRSFVNVLPDSNMLSVASPVIFDGDDGQRLTLCNVSIIFTMTLPDESLRVGSRLRLGGKDLDLKPRSCIGLVHVGRLNNNWVLVEGGASTSGASVAAPPVIVQKEISFVLGSGADLLVGDTITVPRLVTSATAGNLVRLYAKSRIAPQGAPITIELKINGTTTGTASIAPYVTFGFSDTFSTLAITEGDILSVVVTGVGSVVAGRDVHFVAVVQ